MSPGPQDGSVHVERYGSSIVTNNRPSPSNKYGIESKGNKVIFKGSHNAHHQYYNVGYAKPPDVPRPQQGGQQNNWVGVPLISMANNNRRHRKPFGNVNGYGPQSNFDEDTRCIELNNGQQIPLSKLALHTQGAPLIIQGRYPNNNNQRRFVHNNNNPKMFQQSFNNRSFKGVDPNNRNIDNGFSRCKNGFIQNTNQSNNRNAPNSTNIDSVSVTSDESSGSGNSEACLPRIIKPRKRRKKDRKPNITGMAESGQTRKYEAVNEPVATNNMQRQHYNPMCYDVNNVRNKLCLDNNYMLNNLSSPTPSHHNEERFPFCDTDLLPEFMLNVSPDDSIRSSKFLCERFKRSECKKSSLISAVTSVCQCRYCDPSGHIWEIDNPNFSEIFEGNSSTDFAPTKLADSMKAVGSTKGGKDQPERDPTLRRSWSDPSSTHSVANLRISEDTDYSKLQPVNSENQLYSLFSVSQSITERKPDNIFGSTNRSNANSPPQVVPDLKLDSDSLKSRLELNLEVSSEIVTSLNGHRDLEIKFFSNSPPAVSIHNNSFFSHAFVESRNVEFEKDDALNDAGTVKDINANYCEKPVCDKDNVTSLEGKLVV